MSNDKQTWDILAAGYIRKVEKALATVDHPRKQDVIADLRSHLEDCYANTDPKQRTEDHFKALLAEMDPPGAYAELLVPATGATPAKWYRRRIFRYVVAVVLLVIIGRYLCVPDTDLGLSVRDKLRINYVTTPFFDEENFATIQPGMTPAQVRDLIGVPWNRGIIDTVEVERVEDEPVAKWEYMAGALPGKKITYYAVYFDRHTDRVTKTTIGHGSPATEHERVGRNRLLQALADRTKRVGTLKLLRPDNASLTLQSSDDSGCLIFVGGSYLRDYRYTPGDAEAMARRVTDRFGWLAEADVTFAYLRAGSCTKKYNQAILRGDISKEIKVFTASQPEMDSPDSQFFFYRSGVLHELPPVLPWFEEAYDQDYQWLLRKWLE